MTTAVRLSKYDKDMFLNLKFINKTKVKRNLYRRSKSSTRNMKIYYPQKRLKIRNHSFNIVTNGFSFRVVLMRDICKVYGLHPTILDRWYNSGAVPRPPFKIIPYGNMCLLSQGYCLMRAINTILLQSSYIDWGHHIDIRNEYHRLHNLCLDQLRLKMIKAGLDLDELLNENSLEDVLNILDHS